LSKLYNTTKCNIQSFTKEPAKTTSKRILKFSSHPGLEKTLHQDYKKENNKHRQLTGDETKKRPSP
jgi:hypothetical protein